MMCSRRFPARVSERYTAQRLLLRGHPPVITYLSCFRAVQKCIVSARRPRNLRDGQYCTRYRGPFNVLKGKVRWKDATSILRWSRNPDCESVVRS
ncbi:hypothetical protein DOTSEDRAFT_70948 [Dothistroma septosporum NZE10]|uniref:Uncharacterized protein n=1 Tax=Dothistroma septosporum (strain NZE10 / CBS 128990) TaxID=675120 RepID=N1PNU6_DOTSN|nr:hypothetical protein DOTSEDRAFT_70948 [Dothistroma septosporum NZE10]